MTVKPLALWLFVCGWMVAAAQDASKVATLKDSDIDEASGIAASYVHPDCLWLHNDSGDNADLFLVDVKTGRTRAVVRLDDIQQHDWEDMCSFRIDDHSWLMIADVGDNQRDRGRGRKPRCRLLLLPEPRIGKGDDQVRTKSRVRTVIEFEYEDGRWDCESVAVDPVRREILLLTKTKPSDNGLYVLPLNITDTRQRLTARRIGRPYIPYATGMDISHDGRQLAVCTMLNGVLVRRRPGENWNQAFLRPGTVISLPPRKQGETICFDASGQYLYLNSEDKKQPLWRISISAARSAQ